MSSDVNKESTNKKSKKVYEKKDQEHPKNQNVAIIFFSSLIVLNINFLLEDTGQRNSFRSI